MTLRLQIYHIVTVTSTKKARRHMQGHQTHSNLSTCGVCFVKHFSYLFPRMLEFMIFGVLFLSHRFSNRVTLILLMSQTGLLSEGRSGYEGSVMGLQRHGRGAPLGPRHSPRASFRITLVHSSGRAAALGLKPSVCRAPLMIMRQYFPRLWYDPHPLHPRGLGLCPYLVRGAMICCQNSCFMVRKRRIARRVSESQF